MTPALAWSIALVGIQGQPVEVESALGGGLPRVVMVGLPDAALHDARHRCKVAVDSSGWTWPRQLVTLSLSPANLPKHGSHHDLAIALSVLAGMGELRREALRDVAFFGELGLDGRLRPVAGVLPAALAAVTGGFTTMVVPISQVSEARLVEGLTVIGASTLRRLVEVLNGERPVEDEPLVAAQRPPEVVKDLRDVVGQSAARWALEVAAAGRHHLLLNGDPGVGKTLLAERLPSLLPDLSSDEGLAVTALHSLAGETGMDDLIRVPPYSAPHHSATPASIVGGGTRPIRPGAVSLAHRGVLFLDEAPEFSPRVLESLRVPLESGAVTITRAHASATFPAMFQLVLAANPCPCGQTNGCVCPPMSVRRYAQRLSGPILDRIDIRQTLRPVTRAVMQADSEVAETSAVVAERVAAARDRQRHRLLQTQWTTNGEVAGPFLRKKLPLPQGIELLDRAVVTGRLSPRGVDKVLRVAWTVGDLAGHHRPTREDLSVALAMRHAAQAVAV